MQSGLEGAAGGGLDALSVHRGWSWAAGSLAMSGPHLVTQQPLFSLLLSFSLFSTSSFHLSASPLLQP